jgi:hypothetical protein
MHITIYGYPPMHTIAKGYSFDWANILSDSLVQEIARYQSLRAKGQPDPIFHVGLYYGCRLFYDAFSADGLELDSK